jgi:predicted PurR-regulated permease PerM
MSSPMRSFMVPRSEPATTKWARRRDIPIAILAWITLVLVILWGAGHIARTILLLIVAALLAYALAPGVKLLQRFMPRVLAILIMYLLVLGSISFLFYLTITTAIGQASSLAVNIQGMLTPSATGHPSSLEQTLRSFGISQAQIAALRAQLTSRLEGAATDAIPLVRSLFDIILDTILVAVLSIYLLIDGSRVANWMRRNAPQPAMANFVLDTLQRVVGGYIRGQFLLAVSVGLLVGGGMFVFHVPYAVLLGVMAFFLEFIPVLGSLISGAICTLIALTQGWLIAVGVLIYFVVIHVLEGDVVGPRVVGKAIGLHPVISIAALIAGSELFGIWGALLASPIAGVLQALVVAVWKNWRATHPEHFTQAEQQIADKTDESLADHPASTSKDTMTDDR